MICLQKTPEKPQNLHYLRILWLSWCLLQTNYRMNCTRLFRCCFISALERNYFIEKWIGDHTLVTIFKNDYNLDFASKRYINRYLRHLLFEGIYIHYEMKKNIIGNNDKKVRAVFYFCTRLDKIPDRFFHPTSIIDQSNYCRRYYCRQKTLMEQKSTSNICS